MTKPSSRLCAVAFTLLALSGGPAPAGSRTPDLSRQLEQRADQFFAGSRPGGVVLVRRGDEVLLRKAYGLADVENQVPMRADAVFRLASASKQFTAMAILKLVEAGKFTLDQRIGTLDRSLPAAIGKVTLRQLLTHTSGIRNISSIPESRAARRNEATAQELLAFFQDLPLDFEPGSRFSYSNSNYILLTRLIELHSGQSYAGFLDTQLFKPLGMHQTRYGSHLDLIPRRAAGYQQDAQGQLLNAEFISMSQPQGAGGLVSSVDDLARWDQALYGTSLVRPALLTEAFRKVRLKDGSTQPYGFGWVLGEVQGLPSQEHGGFINGFNSQLLRVPDAQVFVTILTNAEALYPADLSVELAALAAQRPYDRTEASPAPDMAQWLGRYQFAEGVARTVLMIEGKVHSQRDGADPIPLLATADGRWYLGEGLDYVRFAKGADGKARMTLHERLLGTSTGVR